MMKEQGGERVQVQQEEEETAKEKLGVQPGFAGGSNEGEEINYTAEVGV